LTLHSLSKDSDYIRQAIDLAKRGQYTAKPNPMVGALVVKNDIVVGCGFHSRYGEAHAEVIALNNAGDQANGASLYVTLEPCNHVGKTPPCVDAVIAANIKRVVIGTEDPNPKMQGLSIAKLKDAGIEVVVGVCVNQCRQLNAGFFKRFEQAIPYIRLKMAMSVDGRTAMANGDSFWITSSKARADVQLLRAQSCAILSSAASVVADNASLTFRPHQFALPNCPVGDWQQVKQPQRVILNSQNQIEASANLFKSQTPIVFVKPLSQQSEDTETQINIPYSNQQFDLSILLQKLGARSINNVLVECGAKLAASFIKQGLVDELIVYIAPKIMGANSRPLFDLPIPHIDASLPFHIKEVVQIGRDIKLTMLPEFE